MPNAIGINGGMPGSAIRVAKIQGTDIGTRLEQGQMIPVSLEEINGKIEILSCKHTRSIIHPDDVWYHSWQAGGGYGDPLLRVPNKVAEDVARGAVSTYCAKDIYGVILRMFNFS